MSSSKTYQQSLADAGSETRPPMLERGSYIPWASRFRRYLNRKWLLKALDEGPYVFKIFTPEGSTIPRLQTAEDLEGDDLLLHDAKMKVMNMILLSIPNEIYNSNLEKSRDPLALVAHTGSSSRQTSSYYVTHPTSVVDYDDEYQQDDVHNNSKDPLVSPMLLLAKAITQNFSNLTNNRLHASSNTRNQAIIQGDRVNIQSRNSGNTRRNSRRAYVQEEVVEGMNAPKDTGNVQRTLRTPSSGNTSTVQCYNCSGKGHYARN
ncbi:retrovirus-related pol polyprotein from transposon TNT 1-94 [Tanacetum coccineum]